MERNACCTLVGEAADFFRSTTLGLPLPPVLLLSTSSSLRARVSLFKSRNVRLTTQWKQQLHDRWPRPTDSIQRPLFLRSPPLLLLLRTGRYRRVYSRKQLGGEERFVHAMLIIRCGSCSCGGKETDDSEYFSPFFCPLHLKHFFSFSFLFLVITSQQPSYNASHSFENVNTSSKLFLPFTFLITDLYNCSSINCGRNLTVGIIRPSNISVEYIDRREQNHSITLLKNSVFPIFFAALPLVSRLAVFQLVGIVGIIRPSRLLTLDRGGVIERKEGAKAAASANELSATPLSSICSYKSLAIII